MEYSVKAVFVGQVAQSLSNINKSLEKRGMPTMGVNLRLSEDGSYAIFNLSLNRLKNVSGVDCIYIGKLNQNEGVKTLNGFDTVSAEIMQIVMDSDCTCDHCHRHIEKSGLEVFAKTSSPKSRDDLIMVGEGCAKHYFPFSVASYTKIISGAKDVLSDSEVTYTVGNGYSIISVISGCSEVTKNFAFWTSSENRCSSVDSVKYWATSENPVMLSAEKIDEIKALIVKHISHIDQDSTFHINMKSVMINAVNGKVNLDVDYKNIGIALYAVYYAVQEERKVLSALEASHEYLADISAKFDAVEVTITKIGYFDTRYGTTTIVTMRTDDQKELVWFSSSDNSKFVVGNKLTIKGTVKDHKQYNGVNQTVVTRCKVL